MKVGNASNEMAYKMADYLLKKMRKDELVTEEEYQKIRVLNMEIFLPEMACLYV